MPINVKDVGASATKFVQRAQAAAPDYQKGVQGAGAHWQTQAAASNDTYVAGVTAAAVGAGVDGTGVAAAKTLTCPDVLGRCAGEGGGRG